MGRYILVLLLTVTLSYGQMQNKIWYFGANAGIDFNSGTPVALTNSVMLQSEGSWSFRAKRSTDSALKETTDSALKETTYSAAKETT